MNLKKGDNVIVISGKDKSKKGKILKVLPEKNCVIVERINVAKRHQKASRNFQGGIIEKNMPINIAKVMLVCPRCNEPAKIKKSKDGRICKKCNEIVDKVK
jgi:large subunit ribosomal protein L24